MKWLLLSLALLGGAVGEPAPAAIRLLGCFKTDVRFLRYEYSSTSATPQDCADRCAANGFPYAGVEFGSQCWCGDSVVGSAKTALSECSMPCSGDSSTMCGGSHRTNLYSLAHDVSLPASSYVGCYEDEAGARILGKRAYTSPTNTVDECTSVCSWNGYKYAGLQARDECWCGNSIAGAKRLVGTSCNAPCPGNHTQICGSGFRNSVYLVDGTVWSPPLASYAGCYADIRNSQKRALPFLAFWDDGCTVEECVAVCHNRGYHLAGLQYRSQCWCGNTISTTKLSERHCRMECKGDASQICGYAFRYSMFSISSAEEVRQATRIASDKWQAAFNAGDAAGCAASYEENAVMEAKPVGTYKGRAAIQAFWEGIIASGFGDVKYLDPVIEVVDADTAIISSNWTMNKAHGVITKELWVRNAAGDMLLREDHFEIA